MIAGGTARALVESMIKIKCVVSCDGGYGADRCPLYITTTARVRTRELVGVPRASQLTLVRVSP